MSAPSRPILEGLTPAERADLAARLDLLIDRSGGPSACWPWTGGSVVGGYGVLWIGKGAKNRRMVKAHRLAFEIAHDGHSPVTVDHLCHDPVVCDQRGPRDPHRLCCNPAHLADETVERNAARGQRGVAREECRAGHRMTEENTYVAPDGARHCRRCAADRAIERRLEASRSRPSGERKRAYRPRGMSREQLVDWALQQAEGGGCWYWPGRPGSAEYVTVRVDGPMVAAHRLVYEIKCGPIPHGMVVDHTCHDPTTCEGGLTCPHRACIRPDHLAAVSPERNLAADRRCRRDAVECVNGHEFTPENTYTDKRGSRHCRECARTRSREAARRPARVKTHCKNGLHEMTDDNVIINSQGHRRCRACNDARLARYEAKQPAT